MTKFDQNRYNELQVMRKLDKLDENTSKELQDMAMEKLFNIIESDPDLLAVFKRLKDR